MIEKFSLIYGTLLGDASIVRDKTTFCLSVGHGDKQFTYLQWKAGVLGATGKLQPYTTGYGMPAHSLHFYEKALLEPVYNNCIRAGRKTVSPAWINELDDLSLAVWYQDDGSWGRCGQKNEAGQYIERYSRFSACGFDENSLELLVRWLADLGIESRIRPYGGYRYIILGQVATIRLWERVAPYIMIPSKLDLESRPGIAWCACGSPLRQSETECDKCLKALACECLRLGFPRRQNDTLVRRLKRRFGTYSIQKAIQAKALAPLPSAHWLNIAKVGRRLP